MNISYNIHKLLKIRIENASWHLIRDLNFRYHYFEDKALRDPDIVINIGSFKPNLKGCVSLGRKFYARKNYIYLKDSDKNLRWEAEIFDIEEDFIRINFNHNSRNYFKFPWCLFPDLIMELYILQPLIEWRLSLKNCLLLHSAAICNENRATLIAGRGGSQKTQHVIDLLQRGFKLISDDMVILNGIQVLSLPVSLGLFTFSYEKIGKEELNFMNRVRLFEFLLRKNNKLVPVVNQASLDKVFLIFLTQKGVPKIRDLDVSEAVDHLAWNQEMEKTSYVSYKYIIGDFLNAYEYVFPRINFGAALGKVKEGLIKDMEMNKVATKAIELPQGQSASHLICV